MSTQNMSLVATREQAGHILGSVENQLLALPRETAQLIVTPHLALYQARHQQMLDELVGDITKTIIVRVKIKRGRSGRQLFKDTGRVQYVTASVADGAPLIGGNVEEEVEYHFFNPGRRMSDAYFNRNIDDKRYVNVNQSDNDWNPNMWFGGAVSNFLWINSLPLLGGSFF